ncbi:CheR family methyltransferase [Pseudomonas fontis]|uniref:protein-glutamate O-methyltransferase n=1 Tax=Pseudomonas fontis TaxID=2942633 RepID=A0ABT5NU12_9PSED|nr:CheR family methyltransferase [Pseudomonas fontis]MDD0975356.1 chemotaxis protein CheR [Pseudomonas fontis]MDD0991659.1 chemotaxis protein CheR [Pseudomonas fontis]
MSNEQRFFRFLQERIGLDVASVGAPMVERALHQRCATLQAADLDEYWLRLQQSREEQQALIEAVIVPETWFFRYPESFNALVGLALKRLAELAGTRPLRILSLPCSTGEEPYSIAMALLDAGIAGHAFRVDAIDISPNSIARAEQGQYGRNSFRGSDLTFRERHFTEVGEGQRLAERVRKQVNFEAGNVLDPALRSREGSYDFVFCRNLLIYFDVPTQQRVFEVLKNLTHEGGVLFIGPAEGSLLARMGMRPLGIAQSFAYVRHTPVVEPVPAPVRVLPSLTPLPPARMPVPARGLADVARRPILAPPAKPAPNSRGDQATQLLGQIAQLANAGQNEQAQAACQTYLQQFEPCAQVFYWLGLLSDTAGDAGQALSHYRKALYLDPQHPEALVHLAALLASQGDEAGARRLQERAARLERTVRGPER